MSLPTTVAKCQKINNEKINKKKGGNNNKKKNQRENKKNPQSQINE